MHQPDIIFVIEESQPKTPLKHYLLVKHAKQELFYEEPMHKNHIHRLKHARIHRIVFCPILASNAYHMNYNNIIITVCASQSSGNSSV